MYELSFISAPGIGPKTFQLLLKTFGSSEAIWEASLDDLEKAGIGPKTRDEFGKFRKTFNPAPILADLVKKDIQFIGFEHKDYPESLKKLEDPPIGLFLKGDVRCLRTRQKIGVVGTRKITTYGEIVTEKLVTDLTQNYFTIVSGLALGVDSTAHQACLDTNGVTIAVLGCGVDCCNPRENQRLYDQILHQGGAIVSEYLPGTPPTGGTFPARNRIIAALSMGVLVTEAAEDSGSLITATHAQKLEKPVFAVPGPITSKLSQGSLKLLRNGAQLVTSVDDILTTFDLKPNKKSLADFDGTPEEKKILEFLINESLSIDELAKKTKTSIISLNITLSDLEMRGILVQDLGKWVLK